MIGRIISHYRILEKLGEGGMGVVYKAHDTTLDRTVALKFLPDDYSSSEQDRLQFLREAKAAAALNHPNILNVHDIGEQEGNMFIVMEYVEGMTLRNYMDRQKSTDGITVGEALELTSQIVSGLNAAHKSGIIHCDVKPENIMLTRDNVVKTMDFGIARLTARQPGSQPVSLQGSLPYMSPEQLNGLELDRRTDIWSAGVVLYEMLTGELPFRGVHEPELVYRVLNEDPFVPSTYDRRIPPSVDSLVLRILQKDPAKRFASMDELHSVLTTTKKELDAAGETGRKRAIALLPFDNISPDQEGDYFSDGLTEELILNLSRLKHLRVVSKTSSMQYKGVKKGIRTIGKELGARYILEGSVRKFSDELRITAQLVDVELDEQLWAEKYKGTIADVFDIQEKVSRQIVDALMVKLSPGERAQFPRRSTLDAAAFDYYLRARNSITRMTKNDMKSAIELFRKAIELDGRYAAAWAGLGEAYAALYLNFERKESYLDLAIDAGTKALAIDGTLAEAYTALGMAYFDKKMPDEALTAVRKAIDLDPNSFMAYWILGRIYHTTDRDREAIEPYNKVATLNPDFYAVHMDLRTVYERLGETAKYETELHRELEVYPRYISKYPEDPRAHIFYAVALARAGRRAEGKKEAAKAIELNPMDPLMLYNTACFYAQLGEKSDAIATLQQAIHAGLTNVEWVERDPDLEGIRHEPAFDTLLSSMREKNVSEKTQATVSEES